MKETIFLSHSDSIKLLTITQLTKFLVNNEIAFLKEEKSSHTLGISFTARN